MRRLAGWMAAASLAVAAATVVAGPAGPAGAVPPDLPAPDSHGITVPSGQLDPVSGSSRLVDATMRTPNVFAPGTGATDGMIDVHVRLLLPPNYDPNRAEPYDVLYLLHGGAGDYAQWSGGGAVEATVGNLFDDGIVVMPEGGKVGWYSDWAQETDGHFRPLWESFHVDQLVPWVDANFNTSGTREGRSIAGVSMGGYGAVKYAGKHPDVFSAVASFSGGFDMNQPGGWSRVVDSVMFYGATTWWYGTTMGSGPGNYRVNLQPGEPVSTVPGYDALFVHRMETVHGTVGTWEDDNPVDLLPDGAYDDYSTRFALYSGQSSGPWWEQSEPEIGGWNDAFHAQLDDRDIDNRYCTGPGDHSFDHWKPELQDFLRYLSGSPWANCLDRPTWGPPQP